MKNIISLFLLFLLIGHGLLQFTFYKIMQAKYRSDMIEQISNGIPDSFLSVFKFEKNNYKSNSRILKWTEDDEFLYQNSMYDVVKTKTVGNSLYLYCIMDENESQLYSCFEKYLEYLEEEEPDKFKDLSSINSFFSQFYSCSPNYDFNNHQHLMKNRYCILTSNTLDGVIILNTPPPRS